MRSSSSNQLLIGGVDVPAVSEDIGDLWETPDLVAQRMAHLAATLTPKGNPFILEPCAGSGQIAQFLPEGAAACEPMRSRYEAGCARAPWVVWSHHPVQQHQGRYGAIVTNPPFLIAGDLLAEFDRLLAPSGVLILLLPTDAWQTKGYEPTGEPSHAASYRALKESPFVVVGEIRIVGRVAYLRDGVPESGRRRCDSIFVLRRQGKPMGLDFLEV